MADYFQHHHRDDRRVPARVRTHAHSDHTGPVLAGLALLMLAVLALLWTGKETVSPLPQTIAVSQAAQLPQPAAIAPAPAAKPAPAPAPIAIRAAPPVSPPPSDAVAAAGDTRSLQP
jgi:hypothetical protein